MKVEYISGITGPCLSVAVIPIDVLDLKIKLEDLTIYYFVVLA